MMIRIVSALLMSSVLLLPASTDAQSKRPAGWQTRFDRGEHANHGADSLVFETMTPGFHVKTGPAVILWHPDSSARADAGVEAVLHLFDTKGRDREGYGLIVGGKDLAGDGQAYTYFLLRNDGKFILKQRKGAETPTVMNWTDHPAIAKWTAAAGESVKNTLAVKPVGSEVHFLVNGQVVHRAPKSQVDTNGIFGVRVNHSVNLHIERIGRAR
jgi:hypothetical protein